MSEKYRPHARFMQRFGAYFIDAGLLFFIYTPFHFYNIIEGKSLYLFFFYQSIWLLYKPFCEFFWGQTLGKAALRIKVTTDDYTKLGFVAAFNRNLFFMLHAGVGYYFYNLAFTSQYFLNLNDYRTFQATFFNTYPLYNILFYSTLALIMIDAIYLMFMGGIKEKSWHDKWAKTTVISVEK
jgi:uncharacterized RDD family membrane protein YckC